MALAYTAPTWTDGSGEGISASNLQAISNCIEGLVQGSDKAIHNISINGSTITFTFVDGTIETAQAVDLKGISSIAKTGTLGNVDTYTITYSDGTTSTFYVTNGRDGAIQYTAGEGINISDENVISATVDVSDKAAITAIAPNEPNATASQAYAVGEHFYKNGKFCTAKTAIASGATFTLGTNYTEGTVAEFVNTAYTETERDTGIKWIDGKTVYEKVIYVPYSSMTSDGSYKLANISPGVGTSIIDISGIIGTSRGKCSISTSVISAASNDNDNLLVRFYYSSIAFRASGATTIATWAPYVYAIVKYIKTS